MLNAFTRLALTCVVVVMSLTAAQAAEVTLRFGHFWPAVAGMHKNIFQVWADTVEAQSRGRIKVEMYPSATLAKPPAQYEFLKNGIMDLTATVQGYSANRFPLTQVVELPGVAENGAVGSCVLQGLYDEGLIAGEYSDTKPIFLFTHGPGLIHTREKPIQVPEDLTGLRIRRPTTVVSGLLEQFGAQPVGMPAPASYQAMQRGVIDGVALPWEAMVSFRLNELAPLHTEVGGLYTLSFIVTMSRQTYDGLPNDLKRVIDANSGMEWAAKAGAMFDQMDVVARAEAVEAGHKIVTVEGGIENPAWKTALSGAVDAYLAGLEEKNLPARAVYDRAVELAQACRQ